MWRVWLHFHLNLGSSKHFCYFLLVSVLGESSEMLIKGRHDVCPQRLHRQRWPKPTQCGLTTGRLTASIHRWAERDRVPE